MRAAKPSHELRIEPRRRSVALQCVLDTWTDIHNENINAGCNTNILKMLLLSNLFRAAPGSLCWGDYCVTLYFLLSIVIFLTNQWWGLYGCFIPYTTLFGFLGGLIIFTEKNKKQKHQIFSPDLEQRQQTVHVTCPVMAQKCSHISVCSTLQLLFFIKVTVDNEPRITCIKRITSTSRGREQRHASL